MKAVGIVLAGGSSIGLKELVARRAGAAMPMMAGYRSIDFALSNLTNCGVKTVAVLTQYNARSLNEHLNSSKWWNFGRKNGGLYTFSPTITNDNNWWYRGTADSIYQNLEFLKHRHEPYVFVYPGECICKVDLNAMIEFHEKKGADLTIAVQRMDDDEEIKRFGVVEMDSEMRIHQFSEKPMKASSNIASMGIYLIRRRALIELMERAHEEQRYDLVNDILIRYKDVKKIYGFNYEGYWSNINTVKSYYKTNMDFLKKEVRDVFYKDPAVRTKVDDLPSAKLNEGSEIKNSLVGSGCIVNGKVEDSVVFKQAFIGRGAVIKNSLILNGAYIDEGAYIENCIVECREHIKKDSVFTGSVDEPLIVCKQGKRYEFDGDLPE